MTHLRRCLLLAFMSVTMVSTAATAETIEKLVLRGKIQNLHLYGPREGPPVIVSSGDGGWIHLGPQVAALLGTRGFFVVGFDCKAYLESFTSGSDRPFNERMFPRTIRLTEVHAGAHSTTKPVLIGVSEGAALSVLAATDPGIKTTTSGVIVLGAGQHERARLAVEGRDDLPHPRGAERADIQHRGRSRHASRRCRWR